MTPASKPTLYSRLNQAVLAVCMIPIFIAALVVMALEERDERRKDKYENP